MDVKLVEKDGVLVLEDPSQANVLFEAIVSSLSDEELKKTPRCPVCKQRTSFKTQPYYVTKHMVEILFRMRRLMIEDPQQHGYVMMREDERSIKDNERLYSMSRGGQQNHKMAWLGLITPLTHDLKPCNPDYHGSERMRSAYTVTQKGLDLLYGKTVSPFQIHRRRGKTIITDEDKKTAGTVLDAKEMTAEDYELMCKNAQITSLLVPAGHEEQR
jgi:hypothetical protein